MGVFRALFVNGNDRAEPRSVYWLASLFHGDQLVRAAMGRCYYVQCIQGPHTAPFGLSQCCLEQFIRENAPMIHRCKKSIVELDLSIVLVENSLWGDLHSYKYAGRKLPLEITEYPKGCCRVPFIASESGNKYA